MFNIVIVVIIRPADIGLSYPIVDILFPNCGA